jgi:hypothetical protein
MASSRQAPDLTHWRRIDSPVQIHGSQSVKVPVPYGPLKIGAPFRKRKRVRKPERKVAQRTRAQRSRRAHAHQTPKDTKGEKDATAVVLSPLRSPSPLAQRHRGAAPACRRRLFTDSAVRRPGALADVPFGRVGTAKLRGSRRVVYTVPCWSSAPQPKRSGLVVALRDASIDAPGAATVVASLDRGRGRLRAAADDAYYSDY